MSTHQCSVFSLCMAAIACLISIALVGIAFSTDNWTHISVNRQKLHELADHNATGSDELRSNLDYNANYFDRVKGIFRVCFPDKEKPKPKWITQKRPSANRGHRPDEADIILYLNPVDEWCTSINYYVSSFEAGIVPNFLTTSGSIWLHLIRSCIICFGLYFMLMAIGCVLGLTGCWKASGKVLMSTGILMLFAAMFGAAGMGFWHGAKFYEMYKVYDVRLDFYPSWSDLLRDHTSFHIGWSYLVAWVGVGLAFVSSLLLALSGASMKKQFESFKNKEAVRVPMMYNMSPPPPQYHYPSHTLQYNFPSSQSPPPPFSSYDSSSGYFSVGYPHRPESIGDTVCSETRLVKGKYKNVVKQLEESKL